MADRTLKYRVLIATLKRFGVEENSRRGHGSERMLAKQLMGHMATFPIKCHGEGRDVPKAVIRAVRRRFQLREEDGVPDSDFYR